MTKTRKLIPKVSKVVNAVKNIYPLRKNTSVNRDSYINSFISNQQTLQLPNINQPDPSRLSLSLYQVLKSSYGDNEAQKYMSSMGYIRDAALSNDNETVYFNPSNHHLVYTVAGTHNGADVATDVQLALGTVLNSSRFKEAQEVLDTARQKYNPSEVTIAGHSLGGTISSYLGKKGDKVYAYNLGVTIGQRYKKGVTYIRTNTDAVSILGNLVSTKNRDVRVIDGSLGLVSGHNLENLKDQDVLI